MDLVYNKYAMGAAIKSTWIEGQAGPDRSRSGVGCAKWSDNFWEFEVRHEFEKNVWRGEFVPHDYLRHLDRMSFITKKAISMWCQGRKGHKGVAVTEGEQPVRHQWIA